MKFLIFLFLLFNTTVLYCYEVKGRVILNNNPIFGAQVSVYNEDFSDEIKRVLTDKDGYFSTELDEGSYIFEAFYKSKGKSYKGYSGKNPVVISDNEYIGIKLLPLYEVKKSNNKSKKAIVQGSVVFNNNPLDGAIVYFYLTTKDIKGMPYLYSAPTDKLGKFKISDIIPGKYFVVARKKQNGSIFGPLQEGDFIGFLQINPLEISSGWTYKITIPVFKKIQDDMPIQQKKVYKIKGIAVDENGYPVSGVYAFAYKNKEMGHERPVSISKKTKDDGIFEIYLPSKGKYYIGVREFYGGTPIQGERYGLYDDTFDHHIVVDRDIDGITIVVKKILK